MPYRVWSGRAHSPPAPEPPDREPGPLSGPAELPRRRVDLVAETAAVEPLCAAADSSACAELGLGTGLGASALLRAEPTLAAGLSLRVDRFGSATNIFLGVIGRVHLREHGLTDPYLELTLGAVSRRWDRESHVPWVPGARIGAGIDFSLSTRVRLGPTLTLSRYGAACPTFRCPERAGDRPEPVLGSLSLGARLTLAQGQLL